MRVVLTMLAVAVCAIGCRSSQPAAPVPPLAGTSWRAQEIDGRGVLARVESTLTFDGTTRIAGQAACNRYFGDADIGDGTLRLKPAGMTRMACAPDVMEQEGRFLEAIGGAKAFRREGDTLLLVDEGGRVRVRLAPAGPRRGEIVPPAGGPATSEGLQILGPGQIRRTARAPLSHMDPEPDTEVASVARVCDDVPAPSRDVRR